MQLTLYTVADLIDEYLGIEDEVSQTPRLLEDTYQGMARQVGAVLQVGEQVWQYG